VSIKVAVNYGNYKNRLGAYHAPKHTFLDFGFLRTLPVGQVRNGFAELIKISTCAHLRTFDLLDKYCEQIISTGFGRMDGSPQEVRAAADEINHAGIFEMLKLETPNLHEIGLDRVIAYGHTHVDPLAIKFHRAMLLIVFQQLVASARARSRSAASTWTCYLD
jgi:3-dehydroquinate synthase